MKTVLSLLLLLSQIGMAEEKAKKDYSKYQKIDTTQFVVVSRAPASTGLLSKVRFYVGCLDKEGRWADADDPSFNGCGYFYKTRK